MTHKFHVGQQVEWNEERFQHFYGNTAAAVLERFKQAYGSPLIITLIITSIDPYPFPSIYVNNRRLYSVWLRPIKTGFSLGELEMFHVGQEIEWNDPIPKPLELTFGDRFIVKSILLLKFPLFLHPQIVIIEGGRKEGYGGICFRPVKPKIGFHLEELEDS